MDQAIVDNHAALSAVASEFLTYAAVEGHCVTPLALLDDELPVLFREYKYAMQSWPWFLAAGARGELERCVEKLPQLINLAILAEFKGDPGRLAKFFNLPDVLALLYLEGGVDTRFLIQRTDAVMTATGLKVVEINVGASIGGWQINWMDRQYRKQPELAPFFAGADVGMTSIPLEFMRYLVAAVTAKRTTQDGRINICFIVNDDFLNGDGASVVDPYFQVALAEKGLSGNIVYESDFSRMHFHPDGVYVGAQKLGALLYVDIKKHLVVPLQIHRSGLANHLVWPDNLLDAIIGDKRSLAILYQRRDTTTFSDEDRKIIEHYAPWGAIVSSGRVQFDGGEHDLGQLLKERRPEFVVKVGRGSQGNDVFVGRFMAHETWCAVVDKALCEPGWVVQQYCRSLPYYGQQGTSGIGVFDVVWGVFGFGDRYGGCWLRMMSRGQGQGVINSDKGAEETIVYDVSR